VVSGSPEIPTSTPVDDTETVRTQANMRIGPAPAMPMAAAAVACCGKRSDPGRRGGFGHDPSDHPRYLLFRAGHVWDPSDRR